MKEGLSVQEFASTLKRQEQEKKDYIAPTERMKMTAEGSLVVEEIGEFEVNHVASGQIAEVTGIPRRYYEKMREEQPDLLATNVNTWFAASPSNRMLRTLDNTARAVLSDRYRRIDNPFILETVWPLLEETPDLEIKSLDVTDSRLYIKAVTPRVQGEVKKGDVVQNGILISNSEVGMGAVIVRPLIYRLICTNGMITLDNSYGAMRRNHIGRGNVIDVDYSILSDETVLADQKALALKIGDVTRSVLDGTAFGRILDTMKGATERPITSKDIPHVVELAAREYALYKTEHENVLDNLIRDGDFSVYGLANAVTKASQSVKSYDRATELEGYGWRLMNTPARTWTAWNAEAA
jgi:hypothetical protein